jgi:predicted acyltransferase
MRPFEMRPFELSQNPALHANLSEVSQPHRIGSIDALRGMNMFWLFGVNAAAAALAQMTSGEGGTLSAVGRFLGKQFVHVRWQGLHFYDLIFPLFIFVTGISIVLSLPRLVEREGETKAHWRVVRRSLLLFALGMIASGDIGQQWWDVRFLGVLQRIAICYFFTSVLFLNFNLRGLVTAFVGLLVGYWAIMTFVPVPGIGAGSFAADTNLANWIDRNYLPGKLYDFTRDPEGMLSTLPAIATCLLGVFTGLFMRDSQVSPQRKTLWLVAAGCALLAVGYLWALQFPVIKAIWTSSYVLVTGGYSVLLLAILHQIIDVWGARRWATVFTWIGANAIALYFLNELVSYQDVASRIVGSNIASLLDRTVAPGAGNFVIALLALGFAVLLARYLYTRKIFVRV